ncbi:hypothetical protein GCM10028895_43600 [Pontibacter rugosus]
MDTLVSTFREHTLKVRTLEKHFLVTTVSYNKSTDIIEMYSYLQVSPNNWELLPNDRFRYLNQPNSPSSERAKLNYVNTPYIPDGTSYFASSFGSGSGSSMYDYASSTIEQEYEKHSSNFTYLVIPSRQLFKIKEVQSNDASVDLTEMNSAQKSLFKTTPNLKKLGVNLFGYPIADDYNNFLWLYSSSIPELHGRFDIIYPTSQIHQYKLATTWTDATSNLYEYYSLADSVPTHLAFIDDSFLKVNSRSFDNLDVQFLKDQPTYYASTWMDDESKIYWMIYAPPTTTTFNPKEYITSLNSSLLKHRNTADLALVNLTVEKADNLSHQLFFDNVFTPELKRKKAIGLSRKFIKKM